MLKNKIGINLFLLNITLAAGLFNCNLIAGDIKGRVHLKDSGNNSGVVVYIDEVRGSFIPPDKKIIMDQKNLKFIPSVLPVLVGSTVTFLNNDNVLHNVFSPSGCADSFNLGTWPEGQYRTHTFTKANCFCTILCNVHPDMQAWIVVLQNPYFGKTDDKGNYEINDVPDGKYILKAWYPFYKTGSQQIIIKGDTVVKKDFILSE